VKSYDEVLARIQALSPKEWADVVIFQEHRRSFRPPVLRGEDPMIAEEQQTEVGGSKGSPPDR
jgi:hypothetical protein